MSREETKLRIQQATDIVVLIGENVALKPRGKEFIGLCPFHDDSNPSMYVSPAKQIYKCFSCGAGGDCFSFVMNYHKMEFPEALRYLAEIAGIELPKYSGHSEKTGHSRSQREQVLEANANALRFFQAMLTNESTGKIAREYLGDRQINQQMVEAFQIGYAPDQWDGLAQAVGEKGWSTKGMELAGLLSPRQQGNSFYDRLRHRLIFPILDQMNRPIAFGGRVLPDGQVENNADAKYLNSPETAVFNKSGTLFGIHRAKQPIIRSHTAVIVEGYTDVIAAHQAGCENVVATLGTALTRDHARVLRHICETVVLIFDADEAGQKAADRALEVFFRETLDVKIAILPEGMDPADLFNTAEGVETWQHIIDQAQDAMAFAFGRLRQTYDQTDSMAGRQKIAEGFIQRLGQLGMAKLPPAKRSPVMYQLADLLRLDVNTVDALLRKAPVPRRVTPEVVPELEPEFPVDDELQQGQPVPKNAVIEAEQRIVGCLLSRPSLFHHQMPDGLDLAEMFTPGQMEHEPTRRLYEKLYDWLFDNNETGEVGLRQIFDQESLIRMALDMRMQIDELTDADDQRVEQQLQANYEFWKQHKSTQEYQWHKMQQKQEEVNEVEAPDENKAARRLAEAVELIKSNPKSGRTTKAV